ncbi:hypothetical protein GJU39_09285 [Pedobacter petrophilus]|uniref:Viral A-type inclusion protein n=1 Tax=Pedobacter petrophilus TaxID=1908241 RepID=A0A7K0FXV9_9SPHI|nr:hypothetical protein [Pedobacter petrophilus]MRX76281.1 hypothetical protein [Pedobacter petrophilus]
MNFIIKYFRTFLMILIGASVFLSCKSERNYKEVRQEVIDIHNKVMADGEQAEKYRMMLKDLSKIQLDQPILNDTLSRRNEISVLIGKLTKADQNMLDWMQRFQPDIEGKSNSEAVKYFKDEMIKIKKLDAQYQEALKESGVFLKKFNVKALADTTKQDHHKH